MQGYNEQANRQFRTYFCTASFHSGNRSITFISHLYNKILWTRKNTNSCARQGLKHLRSYSLQVHCNGCTEQQRMMTAGKSATSHCLATSWQGWLLRTVRPKVLSTQWSMGRKRIRRLLDELARLELIDTCRSRVASVMTFPCLLQWMAKDGSVVSNPFIHKQRERIEPL